MPDSLPVSGADTDWREFRARLIRSQTASTSGREEEVEVLWVGEVHGQLCSDEPCVTIG